LVHKKIPIVSDGDGITLKPDRFAGLRSAGHPTANKRVPLFLAPTYFEYSAIQKSLAPFLSQKQISLKYCGMGEKRADYFSRKLEPKAVTCMVLLGWAGSLSINFRRGDSLIADFALHEHFPPLQCSSLPIDGIRTGPILTVSNALTGASDKRAAQATGALAVEMEAYPLAVWAAKHNIPFIHGRVILDELDEDLPGAKSSHNWVKGSTQFLTSSLHLIQRIHQVEPALAALTRKIAESVLNTQENQPALK
jgi:nucleoside phosphorylase